MEKNIAVILSGCGFKDGAEITESVSTLIALSEAGANYKVFAPNLEFTAVNHNTDEKQEPRNALTEAGRIARGQVEDLYNLNPDDFDAVVFPGGFGAANLLSTWASDGARCQVDPKVEKIIKTFHTQSKPIGAMCIAPVVVARVLGSENVNLTIGNAPEVIEEIEKTGAEHVECAVDDYVTDRETKVITTPAYMYEEAPHKVFAGIRKAIQELVEMA